MCLARAPGNLPLASHATPQLRCQALLRYLRLYPGALAVQEHKEITTLSSKIPGTKGQTGLFFTKFSKNIFLKKPALGTGWGHS